MPIQNEKKAIAIDNIVKRLEEYKFNPSGIQDQVLEVLKEVHGREKEIIDATNPFVSLLEVSSVNTSLFLQEAVINLRQQYSSLAQTEKDLYRHMTDNDYINRFSKPTNSVFKIAVQLNDIENNLTPLPGTKYLKATMSRNTEFSIDGIIFSLQYPVDIKKYSNGQILISYDTSVISPIKNLSTNIINFKVNRDEEGVDWLFFDLETSQFSIKSEEFIIHSSLTFSKDIPFDDEYYFCRVWTKKGSVWEEIVTTHSDQIYDPTKPTSILKVTTNNLNISIPSIYTKSGLVTNVIRVDIYTTKGEMTLDLSSYAISDFSVKLKSIDDNEDSDAVSNMLRLNFFSYSTDFIDGGSNGISFEELREKIINNTVNNRQLPITNVQIEEYVNTEGFTLVKEVDVITNRIFLASRNLPRPIDKNILNPAALGIETFVFKINDTLNDKIVINDNRVTIKSNSLFRYSNGKITILSQAEINNLTLLDKNDLVEEINENNYVYNPYYYVLDESLDNFVVQAYDLDSPNAKYLNFKEHNEESGLVVNTDTYKLIKIETGYKLTITTIAGNLYKSLTQQQVATQLTCLDLLGNLYSINGTEINIEEGEDKTFEFLIETNHDINKDNLLNITNAEQKVTDLESIEKTFYTNLDTVFNITYLTNSLVDNSIETKSYYVNTGAIPEGNTFYPIVRETLSIQFGKVLSNLWTRSKIRPTDDSSTRKHLIDVPLLHQDDVYNEDPDTGSFINLETGSTLLDTRNFTTNVTDTSMNGNGNIIVVVKDDEIITYKRKFTSNTKVYTLVVENTIDEIPITHYTEAVGDVINITNSKINLSSDGLMLVVSSKVETESDSISKDGVVLDKGVLTTFTRNSLNNDWEQQSQLMLPLVSSDLNFTNVSFSGKLSLSLDKNLLAMHTVGTTLRYIIILKQKRNKWVFDKSISKTYTDSRLSLLSKEGGVCLSKDKTRLVIGTYPNDEVIDNEVGSYPNGIIETYKLTGNNWILSDTLVSDNDTKGLFGYNVSLSDNKEILIVTNNKNNIFFYERDDNDTEWLWLGGSIKNDSSLLSNYSGLVQTSTGNNFILNNNSSMLTYAFEKEIAINYDLLHEEGTVVLDDNDEEIFKNRRGDPYIDREGEPILLDNNNLEKEIDILFINSCYYFSDNPSFIDYKTEIRNTITDWITDSLQNIQERLLEQTKIFFYPNSTLGSILADVDGNKNQLVKAEQSFILNLYVNEDVFVDTEIRSSLVRETLITISNYFINNNLVNKITLNSELRELYGDSVVSFNLLSPDNEYNIININKKYTGLGILKKLKLSKDRTTVVIEDIDIIFNLYK